MAASAIEVMKEAAEAAFSVHWEIYGRLYRPSTSINARAAERAPSPMMAIMKTRSGAVTAAPLVSQIT